MVGRGVSRGLSRYPRKNGAPRPAESAMSQYEFDQMLAEAVHRIGINPVENYLTAAARKLGWPIPPAARDQVVLGIALLVWAREAR
jgi:hypothetical protein